jgi:hypothetical protein
VAASNLIAPQFTSRATVYLYPTYPTASIRPDWIAAHAARLPSLGYRVVAHRAGVTLYRLGGYPQVSEPSSRATR